MQIDLTVERDWARNWLFDYALPLWWTNGADHHGGGWFDKLDQQGMPVGLPKRLRVQARQAFVYAEAGRLGWNGAWADACRHGLDFMLDRFKRSDGLYRASVALDGVPVVESADLYDQAFVLFALAAGYAQLSRPVALKVEAEGLLNRLEVLLAHPKYGFEEATPRALPLRSNPHMHLLEALLAWVEVGGGAPFEKHARAIVALACDRLIDSNTGAVGEYYDGDWAFSIDGGHLREPGHQFEWAYLLHRAGVILGDEHTLRCEKLHQFGTNYGIRQGRVICSVNDTGEAVDLSSRLWSQTERLRTMLVLAPTMHERNAGAAIAAAAESIAALRRFLDVPVLGLWIDRMDHSGVRLNEPASASSFYHIVTGLTPLIEALDLGGPADSKPLALRSA